MVRWFTHPSITRGQRTATTLIETKNCVHHTDIFTPAQRGCIVFSNVRLFVCLCINTIKVSGQSSYSNSLCPTMKFCTTPACSTSHTSSVNEDWASLVISPDFEAMFRQTRSSESVPRRGMVSGLRRSGDEPAADHLPPGFTRSAETRVYQRPRPCC